MFQHKFDGRGAGEEGALAQKVYDATCLFHGIKFKKANRREDCEGVDRFQENGVDVWIKVDIKGRKKKLPKPHTAWIEMSTTGPDNIGTGWINKDKYIAQMMVYEKDNKIVEVNYGLYDAKDMVSLLKKKVNFFSKAREGTLYELYTRWTNRSPRGTMTVVTYEDIESLPSFKKLTVPTNLLKEIQEFYQYA
jgi:hypothetical protein